MARLDAITPTERVNRDQYRRTIIELLDERTVDKQLRRAVHGERLRQRFEFAQMGERGSLTHTFFMRPIFYDNAATAASHMRGTLGRIAAPDQTTYNAMRLTAPLPLDRPTKNLRRIIAGHVVEYIDRVITVHYRARTDRRMAAAALAVRLYRLDHGDAFPPTLDALVPAYLPAVPLDAIDGKPLRYDPDRKRLWSVGDDLHDDGGNDELDVAPSLPAARARLLLDHVLHLTPQPKPSVARWRRDHGHDPATWLITTLPGEYGEFNTDTPRTLHIRKSETTPADGSTELLVTITAGPAHVAREATLTIRPEPDGNAILEWTEGETSARFLLGVSRQIPDRLHAIRLDDDVGQWDSDFTFDLDEIVLHGETWQRRQALLTP